MSDIGIFHLDLFAIWKPRVIASMKEIYPNQNLFCQDMIDGLTHRLAGIANLDTLADEELFNLFALTLAGLLLAKDRSLAPLFKNPDVAGKFWFVFTYEYFIAGNGPLWNSIVAESMETAKARRTRAG